MIALAHRCYFTINQLKKSIFGGPPAQPITQLLSKLLALLRGSKGLKNGVEMGIFRVFGLTWSTRIRHDALDRIFKITLSALKKRDGVVVALGHLTAIKPGKGSNMLGIILIMPVNTIFDTPLPLH